MDRNLGKVGRFENHPLQSVMRVEKKKANQFKLHTIKYYNNTTFYRANDLQDIIPTSNKYLFIRIKTR